MTAANIPTDYLLGYEKARGIDPELATNYIAHTTVGDPEADALMDHLAEVEKAKPGSTAHLIHGAMEQDEQTLADAPPILRDFFEKISTPPDWVDLPALSPAFRMFFRNSNLVLGAFVGGTLVEGFGTNISKSFFITGRVRDRGVRRLRQNNRHLVELFIPGGLERLGDGWKLSVRIRLIHAQIRRLLNSSDEWNAEAWGTPISSAHLGFAITAFSARLLYHLQRLGGRFDEEEAASFMAVWRYTGHLMGIPETILFRDREEALKLFAVGGACEPPIDFESVAMSNALINSAPLIVGIDDPEARRSLAKYVFKISRALIGDSLADDLKYPPDSSWGVLPVYRLQGRYERLMRRIIPALARSNRLTQFTTLMTGSAFDEAGISYRLPDHVYAEESSKW